ncbi:MAG: hypothetical protein IT526_05230 [Nitrosomonas sp.]|uniref:hypothetical protein n=1 Tax=Nitrosomonas sp. TaxID=42353 RepID=UPI0025E3F569|nr:hypothetical protein [Nitrosomonas sp.]MCC6161638.1 hypothetical protein [Nitrosomonas sp.]
MGRAGFIEKLASNTLAVLSGLKFLYITVGHQASIFFAKLIRIFAAVFLDNVARSSGMDIDISHLDSGY